MDDYRKEALDNWNRLVLERPLPYGWQETLPSAQGLLGKT